MSDKKKPKTEPSRNGPDGEAVKNEEPDQTGRFHYLLSFIFPFVYLESVAV